MSEDEAAEKLKQLVIRCKECKFATCENCEINWNEVQTIETILAELEKKDKTIELMIKHLCNVIDNDSDASLLPFYDSDDNLKEKVKQYFEREIKNG